MKRFVGIAMWLSLLGAFSSTSGEEVVKKCAAGPWGSLEYYFTFLEAPPHIMELVETPSQQTVWQFPDKDLTQLRAFFTEAGLPEAAQMAIFRDSVPFQLSPPFRFFPPSEVVLGLSPATREAIYTELRKWPQNRAHHTPLIIESGDVKSFFATSQLGPQTLLKIETLSYRIGETVAFSDLPLLLSDLTEDLEERALLKAFTRTRSLILRLRIDETTDREALKRYWSASNRQKDFLPFFDSIAATPGVHYVDVAHLLPPSARKYLYTFPSFSLGVDGAFPDSFWTGLNFFNHIPREDYLDREIALAELNAAYLETDPPYHFGDLVVFRDPSTDVPVQIAVFIADDIVYTKSSRSLMSPFILTRLDDLMMRHLDEQKMTVEVWRRL